MKARKELESQSLWQVAFDDERRVIASCLLSPGLMSKCGGLAPTHFINSDCRTVWSVMEKFHRQGDSWDCSSVASELQHQGCTAPEATLVRLMEGAVETNAIERAAIKIRQMSLRCRAVKQVEDIQKSLMDPGTDLYQTLHSALRAIGSFGAEHEEIHLGLTLGSPSPGTPSAGSDVLDEIASFVQRFVILSRSELLAISLWVAHTWAFEASDATPYLAVTSAEMRSGKTRLLEILELLVHSPWRTGRVTGPALARKVESDCPTLLLDEWDATARSSQEFTETLRGILNAGHRRNGKVSVCGPKSAGFQPTDFRVFCPKVIAGIGKLPETVADRSIQIRLKRKAPGEKVARFRTKCISGDANNLKARLRSWVSASLEVLKHANPELPESLSDRQQDGAEPLLAIADAAGGDWPTRAREALMEIHSNNSPAQESIGVSLLADIRDRFCEADAEELSSKELVGALCKLDGRPWPAMDHSGPITQNVLARILAPFEIFPRNLRIGSSVVKGYRRRCFSDAWSRYLTPLAPAVPSPANATPLQPAKELAQVHLNKKPPESDVAVLNTTFHAHFEGVVAP